MQAAVPRGVRMVTGHLTVVSCSRPAALSLPPSLAMVGTGLLVAQDAQCYKGVRGQG
jgi:hypothetical protein